MHRNFLPLLLGIVVLVGCEDPEQIANKTVVMSKLAAKDGVTSEDPHERLAVLTTLKHTLDRMVEQYPQTSVVIDLVSGKAIGGLGIRRLIRTSRPYVWTLKA